MKTVLLLSVLAVGAGELNSLLEGLNAWIELGIKVAGLAAALGGAWRWMIGPGYRRVKGAVVWTGEQLEMIGQLDERLQGIDTELQRGHEHFARLDAALESLASEEAKAVRRALRTGEPVEFTDSGHVDRRDGDPLTDRRA